MCSAGVTSWVCSSDPRLIRRILHILVITGSIYALLALFMAVLLPGFPSADYGERVRGFFVSPNQAVSFWSLLLPSAMLLWSRYGSPWGWCCGILALTIICTASRGGILATGIVCIPFGFMLLPLRTHWRSISIVVILLGFLAYLINITPIQERFNALSDEHEISLSGRITIWKAILPVIRSNGPFGSGAGTTMLAWRRTGNSTFEPVPVAHLHSDPLEIILEYGWLGCAVIILVMGFIVLSFFNNKGKIQWFRTTFIGPCLGLTIFGLHSCGDFLFSNESLALSVVVLLVLVTTTLTTSENSEESLRPLTVKRNFILIGSALVLLSCIPWEVSRAIGEQKFIEAARITTAASMDPEKIRRISDNLVNNNDDACNARLQALRARMILDKVEEASPNDHVFRDRMLSLASQCLAKAAIESPIEPRAAIERARLALLQDPIDETKSFLALLDEQIWAKVWMAGDQEIWKLLADPISSRMGHEIRGQLERDIINNNVPQTFAALSIAKKDLGAEVIENILLKSNHERMLSNSAEWLRVYGSLFSWLAAGQINKANKAIDPGQELAAKAALVDNARWHLRLADSAEERAQQSSQLQDAGMKIPLELQRALFEDGYPWSIWSHSIDMHNYDIMIQLSHLGDIDTEWAQKWITYSRISESIEMGDTRVLNDKSNPELIQYAIQEIDKKTIKEASAGERDRLQLLLDQYRLPIWRDFSSVHWAWVYNDSKTPPIELFAVGWVGIAVDGNWINWARGSIDFRNILNSGLHRICIIEW